MKEPSSAAGNTTKLQPYLSPLAVWALSAGSAIGWTVDTDVICAAILYGFASMAVFKVSGQEGLRKDRFISGLCLIVFSVILVFLLLPGIFSDHTIETETHVLLAIWSVLGLLFFNHVIQKDHARNFGKAIIVWIALLAVIVLMAMTLAGRINEARENAVVDDIQSYMTGTADSETLAMDEDAFLEIQRERLLNADNTSVLVVVELFGLSVAVLIVNYSSMKKWEKKAAEERDQARTIANTDPLTGVKSKHAFAAEESRMETRISDGDAEEFGVVICDVNGLKRINDTLGHKAGDEYIRSASSFWWRARNSWLRWYVRLMR